METSLPLATDSFSYSWLSNCKLPPNGIVESLRESIYSPTNSPLLPECENFNFDISITQSPTVHALADELFSDGLIKPLFLDPSKLESCCNTPNSTKNKPNCPFSPRVVSPKNMEIHHGILKRWKTSTCQTLRILSRYVNQLCQKVSCPRKSTKVDDIGKKEWQVKRWSSLQQASPKSVTVHPICALNDHENSIYEAVLHCKRSIEK